jgi:hypothetical protein
LKNHYLLNIVNNEPGELDVSANLDQVEHPIPAVTAQEASPLPAMALSMTDDTSTSADIQAHVSVKDEPFR